MCEGSFAAPVIGRFSPVVVDDACEEFVMAPLNGEWYSCVSGMRLSVLCSVAAYGPREDGNYVPTVLDDVEKTGLG